MLSSACLATNVTLLSMNIPLYADISFRWKKGFQAYFDYSCVSVTGLSSSSLSGLSFRAPFWFG